MGWNVVLVLLLLVLGTFSFWSNSLNFQILVLLYFSAWQTSNIFQKCSDFQCFSVWITVYNRHYKNVWKYQKGAECVRVISDEDKLKCAKKIKRTLRAIKCFQWIRLIFAYVIIKSCLLLWSFDQTFSVPQCLLNPVRLVSRCFNKIKPKTFK